MMSGLDKPGIQHILWTGLAAIVVIDLGGLGAAWLATKDGGIGKAGRALGSVIPWK